MSQSGANNLQRVAPLGHYRRNSLQIRKRARPQQNLAILSQVIRALGHKSLQQMVPQVKRLFRLELVGDARVNLPRVVPEDVVKLSVNLVKDVADDKRAGLPVTREVALGRLDGKGVDVGADDLGPGRGEVQGDEAGADAHFEKGAALDDGRQVLAVPERFGEVFGRVDGGVNLQLKVAHLRGVRLAVLLGLVDEVGDALLPVLT